jgi:hypothetical protein
MKDLPESIKHRANLLQYIGFGLMSSFASMIFMELTNANYRIEELGVFKFTIALSIGIIGITCIYRSVDILDEWYYHSENKDKTHE